MDQNYDKLSPAYHNRAREASASTAGTIYHVWRAIQECIAVEDDEELFLEGAEDIDKLRRESATLIQLRAHVELPRSTGHAASDESACEPKPITGPNGTVTVQLTRRASAART